MQFILCPCKSLCFPNSTFSPLKHNNVSAFSNAFKNNNPHRNPMELPSSKPKAFFSFSNKFLILSAAHFPIFSVDGKFSCFSSNQLSQVAVIDDGIQEGVKLELMNKPSPFPVKIGVDLDTEKASTEDEALAPFLKLFKANSSVDEAKENGGVLEVSEERDHIVDENVETKKVSDQYYEPKPGDFVMGVVVSGTENKLNVNVGAELLGTMLTKEALPLYNREMEHLLCDLENAEENNFQVQGRIGILKNDEAIIGLPAPGPTVLEVGTYVFAEVLGRTLTGRPLLSARRLFRRVAWHRLRQIKELDDPIEVRITEWNAGGVLTRLEGLRAFLPKAELMKRVNSYSELKENVGRRVYVQITRVDEAKNSLVLSEREAWEKLYLREGTLLEGTVNKILSYGAQIRIGETNRCGLLHVSNITRAKITSVGDILSVGEKVRVLVVKSVSPDKISLSIADLESEPGLFLSNKERVFQEVDMMAKKYKEKLQADLITQESEPLPNRALPFVNESLYANWKWFKLE